MNDKPVYRFAMREDLEGKYLPQRATSKDTGWDVFAVPEDKKPIIIRPGEYVKIPLGFRAICPDGWWLEIKPRSSTFAKKNLHCLYGTLDEGFRGYVVLAAQYIPDVRDLGTSLTINYGDAIGQLIPIKREEMEVVGISNVDFDKYCATEKNDRGASGWGSTSGFHKTGVVEKS